ncbi:retroviral-like aspartic protease family protein [Usitatibacter palustris]|uniref:Aspartyl protease n=1 Tax=Usitatibacter palustris TaxID=2732487 RepID=A0A6M4H408_9PROT|nr:retroviral-like aspartic protease family protein [Usitatibacter palustris]QJR13433.1 hypothetical protein DSM104440_00216 [Usitatibacter palustris]
MRIVLSAALVAAFAMPAGPAFAQAKEEPRCKLQKAAEWRVREVAGLPLVNIEINGRKVDAIIDTGAPNTMVSRTLAIQAALSQTGSGRDAAAIIEEAKIGGMTRKDWRVLLADRDLGPDVALVIGNDFLEGTAFEFDLPNKSIRIFVLKECDDAFIGYWPSENLRHVSLEAGTNAGIRVAMGEQSFDAVIDSAAQTSVINTGRAERLGVTSKSPGVTPGGCVTGLGKQPVDSFIGPFKRFDIGPQTVLNPRIHFADLGAPAQAQRGPRSFAAVPEMIIGLDFLQTHRVMIAGSQRRVYFSHEGGTVFPAAVATACKK